MSEWIKVSERLPEIGKEVLALFQTGKRAVACFDSRHHGWSIEIGRVSPPTHWQPLPELPPRESSFEQWWSDRYAEITSNFHRWVAGQLVHEQSAKTIWDAAIAASKRPDFVP